MCVRYDSRGVLYPEAFTDRDERPQLRMGARVETRLKIFGL